MNRQVTNLRWPADRFYWSVIGTPAWRRDGQLPLGLQTEVADDFPEPLEDLHVVGALNHDGQLVVCAAPVRRLQQLDHDTISLAPEDLPECLGGTLERDLEVLVGDFEPRQIRRRRTTRHGLLAATMSMCAVLMALGLARRSAHWQDEALATRQARTELSEQIAPGIPFGALKFEVARMRAMESASSVKVDASITLAALLDRWPTELDVTVHTISVNESSVSVVVSLDGDATPLLRSVRPPDGWILDDPRLHTHSGRTRLTLVMKPIEELGS